MPNDLRGRKQTHKHIHHTSSKRSTKHSKVAPRTLKSSAAAVDAKITPTIARSSSTSTQKSTDTSKMEEESIAIVSTNTSDASSISSLSGGSFSASSSSSSLQTAATPNAGKVADGEGKGLTNRVSLADIDKTPVSYELSLSMYDGLLETCRPFYFPSDRELANLSRPPNGVNKILPRLEDALKMQKEGARSSSQASPSRKRASPTLLDNNDKHGGRKVRVKTITFQEPSPGSR